MTAEDWIETILEEEVATVPSKQYLSHRFKNLDIDEVTVENYKEKLTSSLAAQVDIFVPPSGSFETTDLKRYLELLKTYETSTNDLILGLTLADQLRIAFSDGETKTICERFPEISLQEKRRYRCVCEYLIRSGQLEKVRDEHGRLVKKLGNVGKLVVLYRPLPPLYKSLTKAGFAQFIKVVPKEPEALLP
jgi:hypothetical protein